MKTNAFARAKALFAQIQAFLAAGGSASAVASTFSYRSRGHGCGMPGNKHSKHTVAQDKRSAAKARRQAAAKSRKHH